MLRLTIYCSLLLMLFSSCHKESLTYIEETELESPKPIEGGFFKGIVTSPDGNVGNVPVEIFQHEKLIGIKNTDASGVFNTFGLTLDTFGHVTFAVKHPNYNSAARRVSGNNKKQDIGQISLSKDGDFPAGQPYLNNAGSNDLIVVSGYVKNTLGLPALAEVAIIYDIIEVSPSTYEISGDIISTDANGYYELLLPKDQEFYYFVVQSLCQPLLLTRDEVKIFGGNYPAETIGPFQTDTQLPLISNAKPDVDGTEEQTVGFFVGGLQCNGELVNNGTIQGAFTKGSQTFNFKINALAFGLFWQNQTYCIKQANLNQPWKVNFTISDYENNKISEPFTFDLVEENQDLGQVPVCFSNVTDQPFVQWSVGIYPYFYEIAEGTVDNNGNLISSVNTSATNGNLRFTIPGFANGNNQIKNFTFNGSLVGETFGFAQKTSDVISVTYLNSSNPKEVKGSFTGELTNTLTNVAFPIKGTFLVKLP